VNKQITTRSQEPHLGVLEDPGYREVKVSFSPVRLIGRTRFIFVACRLVVKP
jgi:hypothetical protein